MSTPNQNPYLSSESAAEAEGASALAHRLGLRGVLFGLVIPVLAFGLGLITTVFLALAVGRAVNAMGLGAAPFSVLILVSARASFVGTIVAIFVTLLASVLLVILNARGKLGAFRAFFVLGGAGSIAVAACGGIGLLQAVMGGAIILGAFVFILVAWSPVIVASFLYASWIRRLHRRAEVARTAALAAALATK